MTTQKRWVTVRDLLREDVESELASRDGQWTAFREQIQWRLDREAGAVRQMDLEDQAIRAWVDEVDCEVASAAPRFEGAFREELESRIFERGIERPPWWRPWLDRVREAFAARPAWGLALAGGAGAVVLAVGLEPRAPAPDVPGETIAQTAARGPEGTVQVDELAFDGSATVTVDDGVTLVMLASAE
jgi:hypothetical protein